MTFSLTWLPEVLERAGLKVAETPGWRTRGRAEMGAVTGVICHQTAAVQGGNMPSLRILIEGRPDLVGPLCHLGLGRDGTFYVIAAGRANHAGAGAWEGITTGNASFIGIEAENSGRADDPWPQVQMDAYERGVAAILQQIGAPPNMCCGHKEYAPKRKIDPSFDMPTFRNAVAGFMNGKTPAPPIAAVDGKSRPTLRRGARGSDVEALQRLIGVDPDGAFGARTEAALRAEQRARNLVPDGICGPRTWAVLSGDEPTPASPPASIPIPPAATAPPGGIHSESAAPPAERRGQPLSVSDKGMALIQYYEHCESRRPDGSFKAYPDPGSKDGLPWTIGWGSTGADIVEATVWSQAQCDERFKADMKKYADEVSRAIGSAKTTQNQFDAMVSFHYNTGAIATATLTKRHIAGDYAAAREAFGWWTKAHGKVLPGLVLRRKAEGDLYAA